jgi:PKD repeat protein
LGSTTNNPPTAVVNGPDTGIEDSSISFNVTGSSDPDGDSLSYFWDFGDGSTGSGANPSHTYTWGDTFTVTLTVSDGKGSSDSASLFVIIAEVNDFPKADVGGFYSGIINQEITFDGTGSSDPDGDSLSYFWDFGDGSEGTGAITTHSYTSTGSLTMSLTVSDGQASDVSSTTVTVNDVSEEVIVKSIDSISFGKGQSANVTISGTGFVSGASVTLSNGSGPTPTVSNVKVASDGNSITATITTKSGGPPRTISWDVTITNSDSSSGTLVGGFTVTPN